MIKSWESPGGNVTGVSHSIPASDHVQLLTSLKEFKKIGIIFNSQEKNSQIAVENLKNLLQTKSIKLAAYPLASEDAVPATVAQMVADRIELAYLPSDSMIVSKVEEIVGPLNKNKIPTYGELEKLVQSGAMIGIVSSYHKVGLELAALAGQILNGKKPAEIPSKRMPFSQQTILINAKTAEAIEFEIPYPVLEAARIIE